MATIDELAVRLLNRFSDVPNATVDKCTDWVTDAVELHGNSDDETLVLLLATGIGARQIALNTAHYFSYQDGNESVDKTMLTEMYLKVADEYFKAYHSQKNYTNGSNFVIAPRADR